MSGWTRSCCMRRSEWQRPAPSRPDGLSAETRAHRVAACECRLALSCLPQVAGFSAGAKLRGPRVGELASGRAGADQPAARRRDACSVASSAGKNASMRSSWSVIELAHAALRAPLAEQPAKARLARRLGLRHGWDSTPMSWRLTLPGRSLIGHRPERHDAQDQPPREGRQGVVGTRSTPFDLNSTGTA
jgi:hypothetical protein